ncbi:MAG TPA: ribosomal protein S18-alanine N-acetyltransferase [Flexivirga sp.]|uniref:ribosomal protein S18-alanine N-acetyltransferase n=1 Tax=Flexivirga sp. TaxID=1962927 RepID=UPI002C6D3568|nr:ribosomal protein S18-alanine N-acetyltransferase [Flexivirga sp.]HWC24768.1 ribosomal protein S18-alanine N-acetyltransferase [Flexivirga sp.]
MTVELRELQWPDIEVLTALEEQLFEHDAWSAPSWWSELAARPRRRYTVATEADTIVGYAGLDCAGATADIMTIAVTPGQQGRGVGHTLLDWLMAQARESGAEAVLLEVRADNEVARNLYARAGFEHIRTRRGYYRPGNVDAHIMRAHLEDSHA